MLVVLAAKLPGSISIPQALSLRGKNLISRRYTMLRFRSSCKDSQTKSLTLSLSLKSWNTQLTLEPSCAPRGSSLKNAGVSLYQFQAIGGGPRFLTETLMRHHIT